MRYLVVFFFLTLAINSFSQAVSTEKISGIIQNDQTSLAIANVNIINLNKSKGTNTNEKGYFEIEASANDTLHISYIGFQSIKVRVTNDWIKDRNTKIQLTEKAIALEEINVMPYNLTGYLEIDTKLIPIRENYRYSISGLQQGYEAGEYSPNAFDRIMGSIFNPADMLYNFFGDKPRELKRLKEMKKDNTIRAQLESKYDKEMVSVLLGIDKNEIAEIMERCNYSEAFVNSANDLQIMDAISECYEQYKILIRK